MKYEADNVILRRDTDVQDAPFAYVRNVRERLYRRWPDKREHSRELSKLVGRTWHWARKFFAEGTSSMETLERIALALDTTVHELTDPRTLGFVMIDAQMHVAGFPSTICCWINPEATIPWNHKALCAYPDARSPTGWVVTRYNSRQTAKAYEIILYDGVGLPAAVKECSVLIYAQNDLALAREWADGLKARGYKPKITLDQTAISKLARPEVMLICADDPISVSDTVNTWFHQFVPTVIVASSSQSELMHDRSRCRYVARANSVHDLLLGLKHLVNFYPEHGVDI